jgi:hypothetical protein
MVDYHTFISDAVSGLPSKTYEARQALYQRVRTALRTRVGNRDPALSEADLAKEHSAFEAAIRKVETEVLFGEMRRDQEEYVALSVHKKLILTAKQFERSVRDSFNNNNVKIIRDRLRAKTHAPDETTPDKDQARKIARVRSGKLVPTKADVAAFVQMTQFTARNVGRRFLPIFSKRS